MIDDQLLIERIRRPRPTWAPVVNGSLPVTSFGDPRRARVASVGINPSVNEFKASSKTQNLLPPAEKRFADREALELREDDVPSLEQARQMMDSCHRYFAINPYKWFTPMEKHVAKPLGASYFDGSAVHLDLIQWATDPVWQNIDSVETRERLVRDDLPFLQALIGSSDFELIVLNGRTVVEAFLDHEMFAVDHRDQIAFGGTKKSTRWWGTVGGIRALGWSLNVPDSRTSNAQRAGLAEWLSHEARR